MSRYHINIIILTGVVTVLASCDRFHEERAAERRGDPEIVLALDSNQGAETKSAPLTLPDMDGILVQSVPFEEMDGTKASAISSLDQISSLYWAGASGPYGSETDVWSSRSASVTDGKMKTGQHQTSPATAYSYYVSNRPITFSPGGSTISVDNTEDVIAGRTSMMSFSVSPSITIQHILARAGSTSIKPPAGCVIRAVAFVLYPNSTGGRGGTYNIATKKWSNLTGQMEPFTLNSHSDEYLVPGSYRLKIGFYLENEALTWGMDCQKEGDITLKAGCVNNITVDASAVYFADINKKEFRLDNAYMTGNGNSEDHFGYDRFSVTCNGKDVTSQCTVSGYDSWWFDIGTDGRITCPVSGSILPDPGHGGHNVEEHLSDATVSYTDPSGHTHDFPISLKVTLTYDNETS